MVVLTVVTLGFYYPLWFLRRRAALNRLDAPRKLQAWPFALLIAYIAVHVVISLGAEAVPAERHAGNVLLDAVQLAVAVLVVVQCFFVRDILEDHLAKPGDHSASSILSDSVRPSALMTCFFGIFYLQHFINRHIVDAVQPSSN